MFRELDLSEEQREELRLIREEQRDEALEARRNLLEARRDLRDAVQDEADEETIKAIGGKVGDAEAQMAIVQSRFQARMKAILTPEQTQKIEEIRTRAEERMKRLRERHERSRQREPERL